LALQLTDTDILEAIRQGNERVFEVVFRKYYQALCNYAFGLLKDMDDAEEIVQGMFLKVWDQRQDLEITVSLKSYLYRAVHNTCLNRIKHLKIKIPIASMWVILWKITTCQLPMNYIKQN
jgi:RNA polymerase sigma-70 factor (ECF subfamily)